MLESDDNLVGLIEIDVDPAALSPSDRCLSRTARRRLEGESSPAAVTVDRVCADAPRLTLELRAELRRFLARLEAAR
jgi:hypothetical protein